MSHSTRAARTDGSDSFSENYNTSYAHKDRQNSRQAGPPYPPLPLTVDTDDQPSGNESALDQYYLQDDTDDDRSPAHLTLNPPLTPARDPAQIDRRILIGVGDLATPRWTSDTRQFNWDTTIASAPPLHEEPEDNDADGNDDRDDGADSPWTIEAVDSNNEAGDSDNPPSQVPSSPPSPDKSSQQHALLSPQRAVRGRPSLTEESGGEEILYPRVKLRDHSAAPPLPTPNQAHDLLPRSSAYVPASAPPDALTFDAVLPTIPASPPTAFRTAPTTKQSPRKRSSDEFAMDNSALATRTPGQPALKDDKVRRHRSLGSGSGSIPSAPSARDKLKERRRVGTGLNVSTATPKSPPTASAALHSRGPSGSSITAPSPHRHTQPDFSHLPPSPSASNIPHQFKSSGTGSAGNSNHSPTVSTTSHHTSASVAQSLLRGTQEGWNALDDTTTAEMMRKLDGIPAKSTKARSSVSSTKSSSSRPGTPGAIKSNTTQWEGIEGGIRSKRTSQDQHSDDTVRRRGSAGADSMREGYKRASVAKPVDREREQADDSGRDVRSIHTSSSREGGLSAAAAKMDAENLLHAEYPPDDAAAWSSSQASPPTKKAQLKDGTASARSSYGIPKRGSTSSTNFTGTPTSVSRDSTSMSTTATSVTSPAFSSASGRDSSKMRRNSAGSDVSSLHSTHAAAARDRAAALTNSSGEGSDDATAKIIPPVPPLPKAYQSGVPPSLSHPAVSAAAQAPTAIHPSASATHVSTPSSTANATSHDTTPTASYEPPPPQQHQQQQQQQQQQAQAQPQPPLSIRTSLASPAKNLAPPAKTPTKKWSFSNALNLKLGSHEKDKHKEDKLHASKSPLSPRTSKTSLKTAHSSDDRSISGVPAAVGGNKLSENWQAVETQSPRLSESWTPIEKSDASSPRTSLQTGPASPQATSSVKSGGSANAPERVPSRSDAGSSASNHTTSALSAHSSSKQRLTPSAIPFFRRASSHSIHAQPNGSTATTPPPPPQPAAPQTTPAMHKGSSSAGSNIVSTRAPITPASGDVPLSPTTTTRRQGGLSLGLSSLLKSSSRKSVLLEKGEEAKLKEAVSKVKKEDRSESRISVLMGRKRGKTLSSTDEKKERGAAPNLPPIQMSLPNSTVQRVASLRQAGMGPPSSASSSSSSLNRMSTYSTKGSTPTGPVSSGSNSNAAALSKGSDSSLRLRAQLPTISGSPSVSTSGPAGNAYASMSATSLTKETPTKIPRIQSRGSTRTSPASNTASKSSTSLVGVRRGSAATASSSSVDEAASPISSLAEFGIFESSESGSGSSPSKTVTGGTRRLSTVRTQSPPQNTTTPRMPRQTTTSSISSSLSTRKPVRESIGIGLGNLRKTSNASISSVSSNIPVAAQAETSAQPTPTARSRFSALSPSKSLKLLNAKVSSSRSNAAAEASSASLLSGSPSSSRQSLTTPSPAPDDDEVLGDREMMDYIRRQQARKLATGAKPEELEELLKFPEPIPPKTGMTPEEVLSGPGIHSLSDYEREEINKYPSVYYYGNIKDKKPATRDHSQFNYSYDDDRGDYQVINHDHLAYRYEIIDTLGKGSFGQVLHCRDHCSGGSVAIKIIRNKQRFHHQALVEIKILDNLKKWDPEEKHHVIMMQEYFYFRNHLCIAMELLSINLYELIKANGFVGFSTNLVRRFTTQMLGSLALMRHHRVVHCDLKPENVLLRHPAKSGIKVIDFGSSCFEHEKVYTYIQSRFYRSPEVILGMNYSMAIDMWSLGCILAELYTGYPIFPGENEQEQLACIMEVLGVPDKDIIRRSSRQKLFFDASGAPRPVVNSKGRRRRPGSKSLADVLKCQDDAFLDFISKCLMWDPERRLKPAPAMRHPFILATRRGSGKTVPASPAPASSSRSLLSSRKTTTDTPGKAKVPETPKKSLISGPTPLTSRSAHRAPTSSLQPTSSTVSSASRYRASQPTYSLSSRHLSGTISGYSSASKS